MTAALVPDTTSVPINGKDGTADFTISDGTDIHSYKCILDAMRVREVTEMTNTDTFCVEGTADQEPGRSQILADISGIGKKGGPSAGPLIPAPQGVTVVITFSTGCTLTFRANFSEATADRLVNQNMRIGGRCMSKGPYTLVWDLGS